MLDAMIELSGGTWVQAEDVVGIRQEPGTPPNPPRHDGGKPHVVVERISKEWGVPLPDIVIFPDYNTGCEDLAALIMSQVREAKARVMEEINEAHRVDGPPREKYAPATGGEADGYGTGSPDF